MERAVKRTGGRGNESRNESRNESKKMKSGSNADKLSGSAPIPRFIRPHPSARVFN
jgi:hypothetical protein